MTARGVNTAVVWNAGASRLALHPAKPTARSIRTILALNIWRSVFQTAGHGKTPADYIGKKGYCECVPGSGFADDSCVPVEHLCYGEPDKVWDVDREQCVTPPEMVETPEPAPVSSRSVAATQTVWAYDDNAGPGQRANLDGQYAFLVD